jgi:hypothetical protein
MAEPVEAFTLYLRGGTGAQLRDMLKPFGNGGDLERFRLDAWDAEVVLGRGAEVALIRVPRNVDPGAFRTLVRELHEAAVVAGLTLSDDVTSSKGPEDLLHAFGLEGERQSQMQAGRPSARWGMGKTLAFLLAAALLIVVAYRIFIVGAAMFTGMVQGH